MSETTHTPETLSNREFMRTTYDPVLTERLVGVLDNPPTEASVQAPVKIKTLAEQAFGMTADEMDALLTGKRTRKSVESIDRITAEEMQAAKSTAVFLENQEKAEEAYREFSLFGSNGRVQGDGWPRERAWHKASILSKDPESGISTSAYNRVHEMWQEAKSINQQHDIVSSDGSILEPYNSDEQIALKAIGKLKPTYVEAPVAHSHNGRTLYDIAQDGTAVRASNRGALPDMNGNAAVGSQSRDEYKPFAPQHQEKAKKLIQSLGEKRLHRLNEAHRQKAVKESKEYLGRHGVKIPKPKA